MSTPPQGSPPRGLSEHLKALERSSGVFLPDFDLDAAVRGGRRRARRRTAASLAATAAAVAAVVTTATLHPFGSEHGDPGPAGPPLTSTATVTAPPPTNQTAPPASATTPVSTGDVPALGVDAGRITALTTTATGTTVTYERYACDAALGAQVQADPTNGNQVVCLLPPAPGQLVNRPGTSTAHLYTATVASDAVVTASDGLARFLGKPEVTADGGAWSAQRLANRRVPLTDLQRFLASGSRSTVFQLTFDPDAQVTEIDEVDNQLG